MLLPALELGDHLTSRAVAAAPHIDTQQAIPLIVLAALMPVLLVFVVLEHQATQDRRRTLTESESDARHWTQGRRLRGAGWRGGSVTVDPVARRIVHSPRRLRRRRREWRWSFDDFGGAFVGEFGARAAPTQTVELIVGGARIGVIVRRGAALPFAVSLNVLGGRKPEEALQLAIDGPGPGATDRFPSDTLTPPAPSADVSTWTRAHLLGVDRRAERRGNQALRMIWVANLVLTLVVDRFWVWRHRGGFEVVTLDPIAGELRWQPERDYGVRAPQVRPLTAITAAEVVRTRVVWGQFDRVELVVDGTRLRVCVPQFQGDRFVDSLMALARATGAADAPRGAALGKPRS